MTLHLSDRTVQALHERVEFLKLNGGREMTLSLLCKQLIENGVADWRSEKRLVMPSLHYVARNSGDEWEAE